MQDQLLPILQSIEGFVWGPVMLVLLLGTGLYLTIGLRLKPILTIPKGFALALSGKKNEGEDGEITPFQALTTALSATVGTGNIAGVATALFLGGPGAIFWMWMTALVGMATKYSEAVMAVQFREKDDRGEFVGGPMYYIANGLGPRWKWLGATFAFLGMIAAFGAGNLVQSNSVADVLQEAVSLPQWATGLIMAVLTFAVIIGGIRSIASVASRVVPTMALVYVGTALFILILNAPAIPGAFGLIFEGAFNGTAAVGGFAGAAVAAAIQFGVARGVFSNESGLGSAAIAHAAARTNNPVRQGTIAMLGTFIDTIIICTMTALVILTVQMPSVDGSAAMAVWTSGETGAPLSALAFSHGLPVAGVGEWIVSLGLIFFAFTTIIAWSYYGERCAEFLFGVRIITPYRYAWVLLVGVGAVLKLDIAWAFASIMNALMALPNLIGLLLLSGLIFRLSRGETK